MKLGSKTDLFYPYGKDMYKKMKEYGFDYADYGIVSDWEPVIDKLLEELK